MNLMFKALQIDPDLFPTSCSSISVLFLLKDPHWVKLFSKNKPLSLQELVRVLWKFQAHGSQKV